MIIVNKERIVEWPVTVRYPVSGGRVEEHEFSIRHKLLTRSEINDIRKGRLDEAETLALFQRKIVGWDDRIVDQNNVPIEYSPETLEAVLEDQYIAQAIELAMYQAATGVAASKNSEPGSAG